MAQGKLIFAPSRGQIGAARNVLRAAPVKSSLVGSLVFGAASLGVQTVVDFGANLGYWSLAFTRVAQRFLLIEPHPNNIPYLLANTRQLSKHSQSVSVLCAAVSENGDSVVNMKMPLETLPKDSLRRSPDREVNSGLLQSFDLREISTSRQTQFPDALSPGLSAASISKVISLLPAPRLLKIDIEGSEYLLLKSREILQVASVIVVEINFSLPKAFLALEALSSMEDAIFLVHHSQLEAIEGTAGKVDLLVLKSKRVDFAWSNWQEVRAEDLLTASRRWSAS